MKTLIIGRKDHCDIKISDKNNNVSRRHAILIVYSDGTCTIKDDFSTNKTYINNSPIDPGVPYHLKEGDEVMITRLFPLDWKKYVRKYSLKEKSIDRTTKLEGTQPFGTRGNHEVQSARIDGGSNRPQPRGGYNKPKPIYEPAPLVGKSGTILQRTVASDFFDKLVPIPGLTGNIRLFSQLHSKPITKILGLIKQPDDKAESHPYSFLGFAILVYAGFLALASHILKKILIRDGGTLEEVMKGDFSLEMLTNYPIMTALYFAFITFVYSWISYNIFKHTSNKIDSFRNYLKLISLSQGMFIIHSGILIFVFLLFCNAIIMENETYSMIFGTLSFLIFCIFMIFFVVFIRVTRRFWEISWFKFVPLFLLISILTSIFSLIANYGLQMLTGSSL